MAEFHFNEGAFQIPDSGVFDGSTTMLEVHVGTQRMSVVLTRHPRGEETLQTIVPKSVEAMSISMRRFRSEPPRYVDVAGVPAAIIELTWMHDSGPMFNRVAILACDDVVLTLVVAGAEDLRPQVKKTFDNALQTLKLRRRR